MLDLYLNHGQINTIEREAIMKIVRESMQESLADVDAETLQSIDRHVANMKEIVDSPSYEILCMSPLINNIKRMPQAQQQRYLASLENFAKAYATIYKSKKLLLLTLAGLLYTAQTEEAVAKYGAELYKIVQERRDKMADVARKESEAFSALSKELAMLDRGVLRLVKRKRIKMIKEKLTARGARLKKLEKRLERYEKKVKLVGSLLKGKVDK
ncbi:MAG: hypothetical protein ACP5GD_04030 [Candidatus Micrarchaeia archaeon]